MDFAGVKLGRWWDCEAGVWYRSATALWGKLVSVLRHCATVFWQTREDVLGTGIGQNVNCVVLIQNEKEGIYNKLKIV